LRVVVGDATRGELVCYRLLGPPGDSFLTYAQLRLEIGTVVELP
jgi:hypothetical protein